MASACGRPSPALPTGCVRYDGQRSGPCNRTAPLGAGRGARSSRSSTRRAHDPCRPARRWPRGQPCAALRFPPAHARSLALRPCGMLWPTAAPGLGTTPATSAPGPGTAPATHICAGTGRFHAATSAPGPGSPLRTPFPLLPRLRCRWHVGCRSGARAACARVRRATSSRPCRRSAGLPPPVSVAGARGCWRVRVRRGCARRRRLARRCRCAPDLRERPRGVERVSAPPCLLVRAMRGRAATPPYPPYPPLATFLACVRARMRARVAVGGGGRAGTRRSPVSVRQHSPADARAAAARSATSRRHRPPPRAAQASGRAE